MGRSQNSTLAGLASTSLLVGLLCSGCHLIYPFDHGRTDPGADARVEGGLAPRDAQGEAVVNDGTGEGPLCPGDTPPVAQKRIACTCSPPQGDCDALPEAPAGNERDREDSECNELLYEETFTTNPLPGSRWKAIAGTWTHSCGWLQQPSTTSAAESWIMAVAPPLGGPSADPHYLVEARFKLGPLGNQQVWQVGIAARVGAVAGTANLPRDYISCVVRIDKLHDDCFLCSPSRKILYPDLRLESYNVNGGNGAWPQQNPPGNFDPAAGRTYLLQLWYRPLAGQEQLNCRLYDDANTWRRNGVYEMHGTSGAGHTKYMPTKPGTVALRTLGRAASFDYLRVFRLKTDAR